MKPLIIATFVIIMLLAGSLCSAGTSANLGPDESFRLVQQRSDLYVLDVRTPGEFRQVRLREARLIPVNQLVQRLAELPRDRPILVYCAVGSRSAQVVNYLARKGFAEVYNLYGGIYAWANRGYPILQGGGGA